MPSPSPLHPPESVRRFTSLKVGVLLLFVLLLTLFGVQEGEGDAQHEAQQQLASAPGNTHTESIELPLGRQAAQAAGSVQGQEGQGAARQANAQGAGPSDDRRAAPAPVSKDSASQDKAAASSAAADGPNGAPADAMASSQAGPAVPAGESVMAPEDDDQPHQPATADAMKASAGALNVVPVCRERSLHSALRFLRDSGVCPARRASRWRMIRQAASAWRARCPMTTPATSG